MLPRWARCFQHKYMFPSLGLHYICMFLAENEVLETEVKQRIYGYYRYILVETLYYLY